MTVVEVDRERGRIGLRLSDDPSIEGKTAEDLAALGTGDPTMGGGRRTPRRRRQRPGPRAPATAADAAVAIAAGAAAAADGERRRDR